MFIGKLLGTFFGFLMGRFIGAAIGFMIGHWFDNSLGRAMTANGPQQQQKFTQTLFAVLGHLAKSKGRVTEQDIDYAATLMQRMRLSSNDEAAAKEAFRQGKDSDFPLAQKVSEFRRQFAWRKDLLQFFIEQVLIVALHDGHLDDGEYQVLLQITRGLGFQQQHLDAWLRMAQAGERFRSGQQQAGRSSAQQLDDAYEVLGVSRSASAAEVKKAYRKLMAKHHPDKLASQGLPPEMRESAQARAQEIQAAYELIKNQQDN